MTKETTPGENKVSRRAFLTALVGGSIPRRCSLQANPRRPRRRSGSSPPSTISLAFPARAARRAALVIIVASRASERRGARGRLKRPLSELFRGGAVASRSIFWQTAPRAQGLPLPPERRQTRRQGLFRVLYRLRYRCLNFLCCSRFCASKGVLIDRECRSRRRTPDGPEIDERARGANARPSQHLRVGFFLRA